MREATIGRDKKKSYSIRALAALLLACLLATRAPAQPNQVSFSGVARTGSDTRTVRLRFACTSNDGPNVTGVLSVALEIPQYQQLNAVFDFDAFEGPDAAGPLATSRTSGVRFRGNDWFPTAGSVVGSGAAESFVLEVSVSRRDAALLPRLAAVLRPLLDGPGQLLWREANVKPGGAPLTVVLDLVQANAIQLRAALEPCLYGR